MFLMKVVSFWKTYLMISQSSSLLYENNEVDRGFSHFPDFQVFRSSAFLFFTSAFIWQISLRKRSDVEFLRNWVGHLFWIACIVTRNFGKFFRAIKTTRLVFSVEKSIRNLPSDLLLILLHSYFKKNISEIFIFIVRNLKKARSLVETPFWFLSELYKRFFCTPHPSLRNFTSFEELFRKRLRFDSVPHRYAWMSLKSSWNAFFPKPCHGK